MPIAKKVQGEPKAPNWFPVGLEEESVFLKLQQLFQQWHEDQPHRTGVHVSSLIRPDADYCERQITLMQFFPHAKIKLHGKVLQIFLQGWVIHQKWQNLFASAGIQVGITPLSIEQGQLRRGTTFTPDVIIKIGKRTYIVEIKSMNTAAYTSMRSVHTDARIQAQMYMWLTGIDRAIVLVEDKNTQDFKLWIIKADRSSILKYIGRAKRSQAAIKEFRETGSLPRRHVLCPSRHAAKAARCPVVDACWMGRAERRKSASLEPQTRIPDGG